MSTLLWMISEERKGTSSLTDVISHETNADRVELLFVHATEHHLNCDIKFLDELFSQKEDISS